MILISQNMENYNLTLPKDGILRINLAWCNSLKELEIKLAKNKKSEFFIDLPIRRIKPPNNRYSLGDISSTLKEFSNVKYLAVSNVNSKDNLDIYIENIPKHVSIVPKIESHIGVENIEGIINVLNFEKKIDKMIFWC